MLDIDIDIDSAVDALCILCNYAPEGVERRILNSVKGYESYSPLAKDLT
jgi:hypothetical protein